MLRIEPRRWLYIATIRVTFAGVGAAIPCRSMGHENAPVNALDLTGAGALEWVDLEIAAADTLKRVIRPEPGLPGRSLKRILSFVETKTVWHTKALI